MRLLPIALAAVLGGVACTAPPRPVPPATWSLAWWYWAPAPSIPAMPGPTAPRVYVQVATRGSGAALAAAWPPSPPAASEYVAVWRIEGSRVPGRDDADAIAREWAMLRAAPLWQDAQTGVQIDFDCPTARLAAYGAFLARLRDALPHGTQISVTALLDWFADAEATRAALATVDEFVPQFYDVESSSGAPGIARVPEAAWAARFDRIERPYRVGLAVFGRIERVRGTGAAAARAALRDLQPFDLAARLPVVAGALERTPGEEVVVPYEVRGDMESGTVRAGDRLDLIVPTPFGVQRAHAAARAFGGWCAGAVFFRWPSEGEDLVARPGEVLQWLQHGAGPPQPAVLEASDGACARFRCTDLSLRPAERYARETTRYAIVSSAPVVYVVPSVPGLLRTVGLRRLVATLPPWSGADRVMLGRVFTRSQTSLGLAPVRFATP